MRQLVERFTQVLRTVIGVPDYDRYLQHMRVRHPDAPVLTPKEFCRAREAARYNRPGSRCC
jgi:uncharacterized short protein YbdD (DUF466 family)